MTIKDRIADLDRIVTNLRTRREEVEDQLERRDIKPSDLVDFRVQISAQLSVLDDTIRRTKRRIRDLKLIDDLGQQVKELTATQIATMNNALTTVQHTISATTQLTDVIKIVRAASTAVLKAGEATAPTPV